ncbi:hypothetical protein [Caulobacter segnis]|uniref:hypothetical protein n=1 Tax=Caulobacter segnis TaxID=88688 RepID=UPI001CBB3444|nr:hypothetical protein [Caulobacter segnis]UAL10151.1 hypothetical protein K8940_20675 [Caulobacter segnis]
MKFEVEIDDALIERLTDVIAQQLKDDPEKREQLAAFAVAEVIGWMSAQVTHTSMTDQHTAWLEKLLPLFFGDQPPTAERIYNGFSVPYGRAAYIARVLLEKQHSDWRKKARQTLLTALTTDERKKEVEENLGRGDALRYVPVSLDSGAYRELTVMVAEIFEADPPLAPPVVKAAGLGRRTVEIPSQLFEPLIAKLEA